MNDLSKRLAKLSPEKRELVLKKLQDHKLFSTKDSKNQMSPITPFARREPLPLSFVQQPLWLLDQLIGSNAVYNMPIALQIAGPLDVMALHRSINEIVRRHETLRTTFPSEHGVPFQKIASPGKIPLPIIDLQPLSDTEQAQEVHRLANEEAQRPFDLASGPLLRVTLLRLGETVYILLISMHHIISDGWSLAVFVQEATMLYEAFLQNVPSPLPELSIQYVDYTLWQRNRLQGEILDQQLSYWKEQLAGDLPILELPTDRPKLEQPGFQGTIHPFTLSKSLTEALKTLSRQEGVTLFATLLTAFKILLYRYTEQEDLLVGFAIANRHRIEVEPLIGFFVNTLVIRTDISGNPSFRELLKQVHHRCLEAQAHQDIPFEKLIEELHPRRDLKHSLLFQTMFLFQNTPPLSLEFSDLTLSPLEIDSGTAKVDLTLSLTEEKAGLAGTLEYRTDLFDASTIHRMKWHFRTLLEGIIANPEQPINTLPILTDIERHHILTAWNNTSVDYPQKACIHNLFEIQAAQHPDTIAVISQEGQLTYRELNTRANQLAHLLKKRGVGPEKVVGICVERSLEIVVGVLGILKAGGAYLPLDPTYPTGRLAFMIEDAGINILLTQSHLLKDFMPQKIQVICLDPDMQFISQQGIENLETGLKPQNLAYVIYTSGSTGTPKGVMIQHQSLVNFTVAAMSAYQLSEHDRVLQFASISFDTAAEEIYPCLASGSTLILRPSTMLDSVPIFLKHCRDLTLTVLDLPTAFWHHLTSELASGEIGLPDSLRLVIIGGEGARTEQINLWYERIGNHPVLVNTYGPTEATVVTTMYPVTESPSLEQTGQYLPIGQPLWNTQTYILDKYLQPVPIGIPGELYIGGAGVARGYLNQPELTHEKFINDPFRQGSDLRLYKTGDIARYQPDGNIEFLGRADQQVKIRGFRVELGEVETILRRHPAVQEVVVITREEQLGDDKWLVAYLITATAPPPSIKDLRHFLKEHLPGYMIPTAFVMVETLSLTPSGKVDRLALPAPNLSSDLLKQAYVAPRTPMEKALADLWAEVLEVDQVGIHDNFFEMGGHSLLMPRLIARIQGLVHIDLSLPRLFEAPTIAHVARIITAIQQGDLSTTLQEIPVVNLQKEAMLDPDICPETSIPPISSLTNPHSIFLTGATGFLGAFLLNDLLRHTDADIYCLVRSSNEQNGKKRIQNTLESYGVWSEHHSSRIIPIPGDLSQPLLGMPPEQFNWLARRIETIYHCGASVNFVYPYSALKAVNVLGTQEVMRLACQRRLKPMHYISTLAVCDPTTNGGEPLVRENDLLEPGEGLRNGYAQSKWVAEKLVTTARSRGLPATIYRLDLLTGHSHTGIWNIDDVAFRLIKGCLQLGYIPSWAVLVNMTPVDYASRALVHLSTQPNSWGQVFHLVNPHSIHWSEIVTWLCSSDYPLQPLPYAQWLEALISVAMNPSEDNALQPFLPLLLASDAHLLEERFPLFDCRNTLSGLSGTSITCPPVDTKLLETYFSYMVRSGVYPLPDAEENHRSGDKGFIGEKT